MEPPETIYTQDAAGQSATQAGVAPRLTAVIGALAIGIIYFFLPQHLKIGPDWLLFLIEAILALPGLLAYIARWRLPHHLKRLLALGALGFIVIALAVGVFLLVLTLPEYRQQASTLFYSALLLWPFNVLTFALVYWEIDGGGPVMRHHKRHRAADFMFPQQASGYHEHWAPHFVDYLFLAFTAATALSPADTLPLSRKAKLLMMTEALLAMALLVIVAARAINML